MSRVCAEMIERKRPQVTERMLAENISKKRSFGLLGVFVCIHLFELSRFACPFVRLFGV